MSVTTEIVSSWRRPRAGLRRHLERGRSEPFAFSLLLVFLIVAFVGQWPGAARAAFEAGDGSAFPRIFANALAVLATIPLWYALAALSRLVARAMGGQGTWYGARVALFWALATVSPLMLLQGMVAGMIGPSPALVMVNLLAAAAFLYLWVNMLIEAERP